MKTLRKLLNGSLLSLMILCLISCNEDDETPDASGEVRLATDASLGEILVDGNGTTLYYFTRDVSGESACSGGCLSAWPVYYSENLTTGTGLNTADFGTITRSEGGMQTTYKGWPLYYYSPTSDGNIEAPGETNGQGVNNVWYVVKPTYSLMIADAQLVGEDGLNYKSDYTEGEEVTKFFTDAMGRTLYSFIRDYKDVNNFTRSDFSNDAVWPIFHVEIEDLPGNVNADDFGEITVFDRQQLTYKGWPLYYFGQDEERGQTKGVSFPAPGVWPIVNTNVTEAPLAPTVQTANNETLGSILTDTQGRTLYYFTRDHDGTNHCSGGCAGAWPVFFTEEIRLPTGSTLNADDFSSITLSDGTTEQTTYKGWPLYYFAPNGDGEIEAPGETAGEGANNVWYVAKPGYSLMIADAQLVGHDGKNYKSDYTEGEEVTKYFTDANGRTLYIFINDSKDTNNFTNGDPGHDAVWPIFYVALTELPSAMNPEDFGEITVLGEPQLTYRGWPLYYFGQDEARGENKGISFPAPGVWPIANFDTPAAQ